jgi:hypothetical protein
MRDALRARYRANQRIEEIIAVERDENVFDVFGATVFRRDDRMIARIAATMLRDGSSKVFDIVLESTDAREQFDGQAQFQWLLSACAIREIVDIEDVVGKRATFNTCDGFLTGARLPFFYFAA